jgi:hypothetical protein
MLNLCEACTFPVRECRSICAVLSPDVTRGSYSLKVQHMKHTGEYILFVIVLAPVAMNYCLLGCDTMLSGRNLSTFQENLLSGSFKSSGMLRCVVGLVLFGSGDEGTAILRNVEYYSSKDMASHRRSH